MGSLFSWKSLFTKRITSDDLPTAASPNRTSLTLLLGFGGAASAIVCAYMSGAAQHFIVDRGVCRICRDVAVGVRIRPLLRPQIVVERAVSVCG